MKAIVKSTGVTIDVVPKLNPNAQAAEDNLYFCDDKVYQESELYFEPIDWEQRRYEIVKAVLQGMWANSTIKVINSYDSYKTLYECLAERARNAIMQANALIEELKEK